MTLRSLKKRPTTAPTFIQRTRLSRSLARRSLLLAIACLGVAPWSVAPWSAAQLQAQETSSTTNPGWNLRWRRSPQLTPQPTAALPSDLAQDDVFARPAGQPQAVAATTAAQAPVIAHQTARQVAHQPQAQPAANPMRPETPNAFEQAAVLRSIRQNQQAATSLAQRQSLAQAPIQQVQYSEPINAAPTGNYRRVATPLPTAPTRIARADDFFNNPFAEPTRRTPQPTSQFAAAQLPPTESPRVVQDTPASGLQLPDGPSGQAAPQPEALPAVEGLPENDLRDVLPSDPQGFGLPSAETDQQLLPEPSLPSPEKGSSMRDFLSDPKSQIAPPELNDPSSAQDQVPTDSPSDKDAMESQPYDNPFDQYRGPRSNAGGESNATGMLQANQLSCEDFRQRIARETIDQISLDPSPPFRPDLFDAEAYQKQREKFERRQTSRPWSSADGRVIANGRFVELAYEQVIIETDSGEMEEVPVKRLSEGDLGYLSENWGLPKECLIEQVAYTPRSWTPLTMTYKASNLCSKSLYFEEVNLERYGHTAGPWLQPVVSSAHFFANIAVLPYKMGIHPPNECHYALGYYRPGNCAPWIVPPVPISARGALSQGAFMTGAFWLIP